MFFQLTPFSQKRSWPTGARQHTGGRRAGEERKQVIEIWPRIAVLVAASAFAAAVAPICFDAIRATIAKQ
jgi:hypothetical protein